MVGPVAIHCPSSRVRSGLSNGSWLMISTPSLVTARSVSSVVTPRSSAVRNAASVFSGAKPRAPRWPCRSNAAAGRLSAQIAQASDAILDVGMRGQQRRAFRREGLDRVDDEEMLRGTTHSGKGLGLLGELAQRRYQSIGITREPHRRGVGKVLA